MVFSLSGGADQALFSVDTNSGALVFQAAPDYEAPADADTDNVYEVQVQADDQNGRTSTQDVSVTVTAVNDNDPVITSSATADVAENTTAVLTVTTTDADLPAQTVVFSLSGGADQALFSVDANSGALVFQAAPDYEAPADADTDNVYEVQVQADDQNGGTMTQDVSVTVTPVDDNIPVIAEGDSLAVQMDEDGHPRPFQLTLHASEADGDVLTWTLPEQPSNGSASLLSVDDLENGVNGWTATGFWHLVDTESAHPEAHSDSHSWWYGQESSGDYDDGLANSGELVSPPFTVDANAALTFWSWEQTEDTDGWDTKNVFVREAGGRWKHVHQCVDTSGAWYQVGPIDLSVYVGRTLQLKFVFDTVDGSGNSHRGWYVDDLWVTGCTAVQGTLAHVSYVPKADDDGDESFVIQVGDGLKGTDTITVTAAVRAVSDVPTLTVTGAAAGDEDTAIALTIDPPALVDVDGSETLSDITVADVPTGAALSAGTDNGDGTWILTTDQRDGLTITPPLHSNADFTLTVAVTATEADGGDTATASQTIDVTVNAVADDPVLTVTADAAGDEDTAIALIIDAHTLVGVDGSETLSAITVADVPVGAALSAGTDSGDGTWTLTADQLDGLTIIPSLHSDTDFTLTLSVTATETANNDTATTTRTIDVTVNAVADIPELIVTATAEGSEDSAIGLAITAPSLVDADGSETLSSITITGVPTDAVLSAGTDNTGGSWTLLPEQLPGLTVSPAAHADTDFILAVTVIATEADGGDTATAIQTIGVAVNTVDDPPVLDLDASGPGVDFVAEFIAENGPVAICNPDALSLWDVDDTHIESAAFVLTNPQAGDVLAVDTSGRGIVVSDYDSVTGELSLTGRGTLEEYRDILRTMTYDNDGESEDHTDRIVSITVNDGDLDSGPAIATVVFEDTIQLVLAPKWNLLSLPFNTAEGKPPSHLLTAEGGSASLVVGPMWEWDAEGSSYVSVVNGFTAKTAFWVESKAAGRTNTIKGVARTGRLALLSGWNAIGPVEDIALAEIEGLADAIVGAVWAWNAVMQMYESVPEDGILERGRGYWVFSVGGEILLRNPLAP